MSGSPESVRVYIDGDEYSIKGDVDFETTRRVAEYVNAKISEIHMSTASRDKLKVAILSAMNIAGELFEYKSKCEEQSKQLNDLEIRFTVLSKKIDETVV